MTAKCIGVITGVLLKKSFLGMAVYHCFFILRLMGYKI